MDGDLLEDEWEEDQEDDIIEIEHIVMPGYTDIIVICSLYGITDWKNICEYNAIKNPNDIKVGDKIIIIKQEE